MSLTTLQDEALTKLRQPRSSPKRYARYQRSVFLWYFRKLANLGFTTIEICRTWRDVTDMRDLHRLCDDT